MSITVSTRSGQTLELEGRTGLSLMEVIREGGVDELLALCGGCCSCATCHIFIDEESLAKLPPISSDENDLLDGSSHRNERSRLACQIPYTADLDGLHAQIAPED